MLPSHSVVVEPASLERTPEGTPWSARFEDVYHSRAGGVAQARHVFLGGNGLPGRWQARRGFTILETGFGLGVNFLCAWDAWRRDTARCARLDFVSVERHPFTRADMLRGLEPFAELAPLARELVEAWPPPLAGFHRLDFDAGRVTLTLALADARAALEQVEAGVDAFFLDGFAPARNPGMWSPEVVRELARLAAPGATLATWTVAGGVRAALSDAGFQVEKRAGFAAKREMLCGVREGAPREPSRDRRALVVGGGIAGTLVAERLAAREWQVTLVDAGAVRPAPTAGILRPIANARDLLNARLSRPAFLYARRHYRGLAGTDGVFNECGVLQLASDADEEARFAAIVAAHAYPEEFLGFVGREGAGAIAGRDVARGGWWFPQGGVVHPAAMRDAAAARARDFLRLEAGRHVERIEREAEEWRVLDARGDLIARAPVVVLANAADAARLLPEAGLRVSAVRGQVTYVPPDSARRLDVVVSGNGYVAPRPGGGHAIGATYRHGDPGSDLRASEHAENLQRAESMLPGFTRGLDAAALDGLAGRRTTVPDRLPIYGESEAQGAYIATGLGSRGLLWAPLGAELIASLLEGNPLPLPRDFAGAVSPRRFRS